MARLLLAVTAVAAALVAAVVAQHPCAALTCSGRGRCEAAVGCICWAGYEGTNCERESVQAAAAPAPATGATALVVPGPAVGLSTGKNVMPIYLPPEYMLPKPEYGSVQPEMGTIKPGYFDNKPYYFDDPSHNPNAAYSNMGAGNWWYNNFYNQYPSYNPGRYNDAYDPYGSRGNYNNYAYDPYGSRGNYNNYAYDPYGSRGSYNNYAYDPYGSNNYNTGYYNQDNSQFYAPSLTPADGSNSFIGGRPRVPKGSCFVGSGGYEICT